MSNDLQEQAKELKKLFNNNVAQDNKLLALTLLHCLYERPQVFINTLAILFNLSINKNLSNATKHEKIQTITNKLLNLEFIQEAYGNDEYSYSIYLNLNKQLYLAFLAEIQDQLIELLSPIEQGVELLATHSSFASLLNTLTTTTSIALPQNNNNNHHEITDTNTQTLIEPKKSRCTFEQVILEAVAILHYLEQSDKPIEKRMLVNKISDSDFFSTRPSRKAYTQENNTYAAINFLEEEGHIRALDPTATFKLFTLDIQFNFEDFLNTNRTSIANGLKLDVTEATDEKIFEIFDKVSIKANFFSNNLKNTPCYEKAIIQTLKTEAMNFNDLVNQVVSTVAGQRNTTKHHVEKHCKKRIKALVKDGKITNKNGLLKINESYVSSKKPPTKKSIEKTTAWIAQELNNGNIKITSNEPMNKVEQVAKKPRTTENLATNRSGFHANQNTSSSNTNSDKLSLRIDDLFKSNN